MGALEQLPHAGIAPFVSVRNMADPVRTVGVETVLKELAAPKAQDAPVWLARLIH